MNSSQAILRNLQQIQSRINSACLKAKRPVDSVQLLLATKTVSAENIQVALQAGYSLMGENKVQELKEKYEALKTSPHQSHFIGHLQTNKIKDILKYGVHCVQSLDRWELAEKLHQRLLFEQKKMDVLIQVNTSQEASKFGVPPNEALALVRKVATLDTLQIRGLMTIGLFTTEPEKTRPCFKKLKSLQQQILALNLPGVDAQELSMGMSGDLEIAIEEGATIVRVGTAIFGTRPHPDSYYWNEQSKTV